MNPMRNPANGWNTDFREKNEANPLKINTKNWIQSTKKLNKYEKNKLNISNKNNIVTKKYYFFHICLLSVRLSCLRVRDMKMDNFGMIFAVEGVNKIKCKRQAGLKKKRVLKSC